MLGFAWLLYFSATVVVATERKGHYAEVRANFNLTVAIHNGMNIDIGREIDKEIHVVSSEPSEPWIYF